MEDFSQYEKLTFIDLKNIMKIKNRFIMPAGAPRTVSLPPDQMIALGEEMIQWLKDHPDTLHLSEWYSIHKEFTDNQWDTMQKKPEFIPYYERALKIVGLKYLHKDSKVRDGISHRWQRVYFKDLRAQEDEDKKYESSLKNDISNNQPAFDQTVALQNQLMEKNGLIESLRQQLRIQNQSKTESELL